MSNKYSRLFERTYIGKMAVKNRFVMAPMGAGTDKNATVDEKLTNYSGLILDWGTAYYEERAKGGTGMLIVGFQPVSNKTDPWMYNMYGLDTSLQSISWSSLCERTKAYGTKMCVQLSPGFGRCSQVIEGAQNVSPSVNSNFFKPDTETREITVEEIHAVTAAFQRAAFRAKQSGFDCIEVHAHAGYLLDQFMTPLWNRRTDSYGGSFEKRMQFPTELYNAAREAVGPDFPIIFRFAMDHMFPGGRTIEESLQIIKYLDELGVDGFDLDMGSYETYDWLFPTPVMGDAPMLKYVARAREVTKKPIMNSGNFTPEAAVKAVEDGLIDFVMLGRGLIADPYYPQKLMEDRREDIRPCIRCSEYCLAKRNIKPLSCSVNAQCLQEREVPLRKTDSPKNVVVIGGGPGGMEAARVAAVQGNKVVLYEKNDKLGGQLLAAGAPEFKGQIRAFVKYEETQLEKLGVKVVTNVQITGDSDELKSADNIIVAVGASAIKPPIPGSDRANVMDVIDFHLGKGEAGQKVVVAGGGASGCDCAMELAQQGKEVTIVEMVDMLHPKANMADRCTIDRYMKDLNVDVKVKTKVLEFTEGGIKVETDGVVSEIPADTIITAFGTKPNFDIRENICAAYPEAVCIGDCTTIGQIGEAVRSGFFAGRAII